MQLLLKMAVVYVLEKRCYLKVSCLYSLRPLLGDSELKWFAVAALRDNPPSAADSQHGEEVGVKLGRVADLKLDQGNVGTSLVLVATCPIQVPLNLSWHKWALPTIGGSFCESRETSSF